MSDIFLIFVWHVHLHTHTHIQRRSFGGSALPLPPLHIINCGPNKNNLCVHTLLGKPKRGEREREGDRGRRRDLSSWLFFFSSSSRQTYRLKSETAPVLWLPAPSPPLTLCSSLTPLPSSLVPVSLHTSGLLLLRQMVSKMFLLHSASYRLCALGQTVDRGVFMLDTLWRPLDAPGSGAVMTKTGVQRFKMKRNRI